MQKTSQSSSTVSPRLTSLPNGRWQINAHAKLNLGLRLFSKRPDGFHEIATWMLPISWHDVVSVEAPREISDLTLIITGRSEGVPTEPDKNLAGRAALALAKAAGVPAHGRITLHKVLPAGGGIGGGSADAACTMLAFNAAWNLNWPTQKLAPIAASLGSDIPFFLEAIPSLCTGRGEIMSPLVPAHALFAVLIIPPMGCPTKDVYQTYAAGRRHTPTPPATDWKQLAAADAHSLNRLLINDLEPAAFSVAPALAHIRDHAAKVIAHPIHMTGSGSTLFTLCKSAIEADEITAKLSAALEPPSIAVPVQLMS